ncbi:MAG: hypothetical protein IPK13_04195 [Deltaproteobacteria bacterium]|nr:hypothetical protein [Deltaproteobacteria bacterium]
MGLAERRAQKSFEDEVFPKLKKEVVEAASFDIPIEVEWEPLCLEGHAHNYEEFWTKTYFRPLIAALKSISADDMGKEALKASVQKIVITNRKGHYYGEGMATLTAGVLTLDHEPGTNVHQLDERIKALTTYLEAHL